MYSREKLSITNIYFNTDSTALAVCIHAQVNTCVCDSRCVLFDACTHVSACMKTSKVSLRNSPLSILPSFFWDTPHFQSGSLFIWSLLLQLGWLASNPQAHTRSLSSGLGWRMHHHTWLSKRLFWGLNVGIHACMLNTLQTEPSNQTSFVLS